MCTLASDAFLFGMKRELTFSLTTLVLTLASSSAYDDGD